MALTLSARNEGVTADGKRQVEYLCTFDDGSADDVTKAELGLVEVDEIVQVVKTASSIAIDVTANDATKVTLDPSGAGSATVRFVGH